MDLKELMMQASSISNEKGFWDDFNKTIKTMKGLPHHFSKEDIERVKFSFYNEKLALITLELGEAAESIRLTKFFSGGESGINTLKKIISGEIYGIYMSTYLTHLKDTFENEISDVFIKLFDLCEKMNIDIETFIQLKLEYDKNKIMKIGKKIIK